MQSLVEGLQFIRRQPVLLGAMTLDLFSVLFGGAVALLPAFAAHILHVGPEGLGVLRAAPAAGAVLVSLALAHRPPVRNAGPVLLAVVALFGLSMIGFGLSRSYPLSVALLAFSGAVDMVSVNIRSLLLQLQVPDRLLGRVSSVNQIFIGSSNEIGQFESGVAARLLGTAPSVVFGGVVTLAVVAVTALALPPLRRLRRIHPAVSWTVPLQEMGRATRACAATTARLLFPRTRVAPACSAATPSGPHGIFCPCASRQLARAQRIMSSATKSHPASVSSWCTALTGRPA
jgi:hypothetical protein